MSTDLRNLDPARADVLASLCESIVPGSGTTGPVVYIDALMSAMSDPALKPHAFTPAFLQIRALAIEAYYSDFKAPGAPGPSAYEAIDFHSPLAMRINKDWSYLGVGG